ncbi:DUF4421 family protein [Winogradskyella schleiferi]|uniref:DUF4421 family protein n=1 Tax=Winogradskyella schleiferi TaxID=2686078 RepID=UPI0015BEE3F1|nr:DUF4421 family protein [Winogradskyella schleiferi]
MNRKAITRHTKLTVIVSTFTFISLWAQTKDSLSLKIEDGWIEKTDKIGIDVSLNNAYEIFEVRTENTKVILYPNTAANLRLNVNYKFISFGFQFTPDFLPGNGDESLRGKTKSFELSTSLIFKHWFTDLSYSKVKGYYLKNSNDFITRSEGDPYIQFPDLSYNGFAITTGYSSNSKFSFKSLTSQTERQLKSAGSFIPSINLRYFKINDKSSDINTQKSNNSEASIGPGYVHTFVSREKFYFSLGLLARIGYLNTKLTTRLTDGDAITNQDNFIFRWDGRIGLGYNGKRFYTGIYSTISGTEFKQENTTGRNSETRVNYHLFLGIRFPAPNYLERQVNKVEKLILRQNDSNQ